MGAIKKVMFDDDEVVSPIYVGEGDSRVTIGYAYVEQKADGSLDMKMTMIGEYTMSSSNIAGMARFRGFVPASLRKD